MTWLRKLKEIFKSAVAPAPSSDAVDDFVIAAARGDLLSVQRFAEKYPQHIDATGLTGTALLGACCEGHGDVARFLLDRGANTKDRFFLDGTVLMFAAMEGYKDVVQSLLDHGADINARDRRGVTALILSVEREHSDVALMLIDRGADIDARGYTKRSAFDIASRKKLTPVVERLEKIYGDRQAVKDAEEAARHQKTLDVLANGVVVRPEYRVRLRFRA